MNFTVKDIDVLQAIHPQDVAEYLEKNAWQQQNQILDKASIWKQNNEGTNSLKLSCL